MFTRVKAGNFGHQVNSDTLANSGNSDETAPYDPSHQDFHCLLSRCISYSNNQNMKQTRSLSEFSRSFEFTRIYPICHHKECT